MPNRTVYISDDNLSAWENFKDQYGNLNSWLSTQQDTPTGNQAVVSVNLTSVGATASTPSNPSTAGTDTVPESVSKVFPGAKIMPVQDLPLTRKPLPEPTRYTRPESTA